jgi:hypothetical protein
MTRYPITPIVTVSQMRTIAFIWFWNLCWDDERGWTALFSLMIPIVPLFVLAELLRFIGSWKLSSLSILQCLSVTSFLNEVIFKPAIGAPPPQNSCDSGCNAPSTSAAMALAVAIVYGNRYVRTAPKDLFALICWIVAFVLHFIAKPILDYLTWGNNAISLVPGLIVGCLWVLLIEGKYFEQTLLQISGIVKLENDVTGENFQQEQDLLPT